MSSMVRIHARFTVLRIIYVRCLANVYLVTREILVWHSGGLTWAGVRPFSWHVARESPHTGRPCGWAAHRNNSTCCPCLTPLDHATALALALPSRPRHHALHTRPARHKTTCWKEKRMFRFLIIFKYTKTFFKYNCNHTKEFSTFRKYLVITKLNCKEKELFYPKERLSEKLQTVTTFTGKTDDTGNTERRI